MSPDAHRPNKTIITLPPRAMTPYYHPCQIPEQITTLILKHVNKNRLGAFLLSGIEHNERLHFAGRPGEEPP